MGWIKESKEERDALLEEYRKSPDYYDDGALELTCKYCGAKCAILSPPCCDTRKKEKDEYVKKFNEQFREFFKDEL